MTALAENWLFGGYLVPEEYRLDLILQNPGSMTRQERKPYEQRRRWLYRKGPRLRNRKGEHGGPLVTLRHRKRLRRPAPHWTLKSIPDGLPWPKKW